MLSPPNQHALAAAKAAILDAAHACHEADIRAGQAILRYLHIAEGEGRGEAKAEAERCAAACRAAHRAWEDACDYADELRG